MEIRSTDRRTSPADNGQKPAASDHPTYVTPPCPYAVKALTDLAEVARQVI